MAENTNNTSAAGASDTTASVGTQAQQKDSKAKPSRKARPRYSESGQKAESKERYK